MANVIVLLGAGQIGQAIARRVGVGKHVLLADLRLHNAEAAAVRVSSYLRSPGIAFRRFP
jgi:predicted dinucleotide-binding enzyme